MQLKISEPAEERSFDVAGPTALYMPFLVGSLDQFVRAAPSRVGDSTRVVMANFRRGDAITGVITRLSDDSIRIRHPRFEVWIRISDQLEILSGTTILSGDAPTP